MSAAELLAHVFGNECGIVAGFSGRRGDPLRGGGGNLAVPRSAYFRWPREGEVVLEWLRDEDGRRRETYICAHLLEARRRVKGNAAPLLALYVDGDGAKPTGPDTPIPTAVVESSPGREHYYWRLARPIAPEFGESLNRRLALAMGGDRSGWDLTQLLRPPGTRNHKYPDAPLVVLRELRPGVAHDPDELDRVLPPLPPEQPRRAPHPQPGGAVGGTALDDAELVRRATGAANGGKFARLWAGDTTGYGSGSEADLALCSMLAFWCGPDDSRIARLFGESGLCREKWICREDYRRRTIAAALDGRDEAHL